LSADTVDAASLCAALGHELSGKGLTPPVSAANMDRLGDAIAVWFAKNVCDVPAVVQVDFLRRFTYERGALFHDVRDAELLTWLLSLIGRLVRSELPDQSWPPPIQFRVKSLFNKVDRLGDYVLLYEAFIHFHFVAVASQFVWMTHDLGGEDQLPATLLAQKIVHAALTTRKCMGGRVWLHRAGGISRAGHELLSTHAVVSGRAPIPELFALLEPQDLELHTDFANAPGRSEIVRRGGPTFRLFELLQQIRNTLVAHNDAVDAEVAPSVSDGLLALAGVLGECLSLYRAYGLAITGRAGTELALQYVWSETGELISPNNRAARQRYFVKTWGAPPEPQAPFAAPEAPRWENWVWDDSLLLFDRAAPRERYLYLMPLGYRYEHEDAKQNVFPGLLDSVIWRKQPGTQRRSPTIIQRKYLDRRELDDQWQDQESRQSPHIFAAQANVQALVERIASTYRIDVELPDEEGTSLERVFDLRHGDKALELSRTVPRTGVGARPWVTVSRSNEVERILTHARASRQSSGGLGRLLLVGPSGIGKSVLMAQTYARVHERALYFSMDHAPEPEYEPPPSSSRSRESAALPALGLLGTEFSERTRGVPVRMHWLASLARLLGRPAPLFVLQAAEAQRQIAALLQEAAAGSGDGEPFYILVDAVNQEPAPESLLQGLRPFSSLPTNVVIIASTQDNPVVLSRLSEGDKVPWEIVPAQAFGRDQTKDILLGAFAAEHNPTLSDEFVDFVYQKSEGLPFLASYWAERFERHWRVDAANAERLLKRDLQKGDAGLLPRSYFERLTEASRDFIPQKLPEALLWCFSMASRPLGREQLTQAAASLRGPLENLPDVSKSDVDNAAARLGGFLITEMLGAERVLRLTHPMVGKAWLDYYGTPAVISRINDALLKHGATPLTASWSDQDRDTWLGRVFEGSSEFDQLDIGQKQVIVSDLLVRNDASTSWSHRRGGLLCKQAGLLHELGRGDESLSLALRAFEWATERAHDPTLSLKSRCDIDWDRGAALTMRGVVEWSRQEAPRLVSVFEEALLLRSAAQADAESWTAGRRQGLASALRNLGIALNAAGRKEEATQRVTQAIEMLSALESREPDCLTDLAEAYETRAEDPGSALADLGKAIEIRESLGLTTDKARQSLGVAYENRAITNEGLGLYQVALSDYEKALTHFGQLDLTKPEYRGDLARVYQNRGGDYWSLKQRDAALLDYGRAIELREALDLSIAEHANELAGAYDARAIVQLADVAISDYTRAIELRETLDLSKLTYRIALAQSYRHRAFERRRNGQPEAALADHTRAIELRETLDLSQPDHANGLALARFSRGNLLSGAAAISDYTRAIDLWGALDLAEPTYRLTLASCYENRGIDHKGVGAVDAAIADFSRAIELCETLDLSKPEHANELARAYNSRGNSRSGDAAISDYSRAIEIWEGLDISDLTRRALLAESYQNRGVDHGIMHRSDAALADYGRAIELRASFDLTKPEHANSLARLHYFRGNAGAGEGAISDYTRAIELWETLGPANSYTVDLLSSAYHNRGKSGSSEGTISDYTRAIELRETLDLSNPAMRARLADSYRLRGNERTRIMGAVDGVLADYSRAIELRETLDLASIQDVNLLASIYQYRGNVGSGDAAISDYTRAIELREAHDLSDPTYRSFLADSYLNRGIDRVGIGQPEAAQADYSRAIELHEALDLSRPEHVDGLAIDYHLRGNARTGAAAISDYTRAIELRETLGPSSALHRARLADSYQRRGVARSRMQQADAAVADLSCAIELHEALDLSNPDQASNLARAYTSRGNARSGAAAICDYTRAVEILETLDISTPAYGLAVTDAYRNRGLAHGRVNQLDPALADFDREIELREKLVPPNQERLAESYRNRGLVYSRTDRYDAALADFSRSIELRELSWAFPLSRQLFEALRKRTDTVDRVELTTQEAEAVEQSWRAASDQERLDRWPKVTGAGVARVSELPDGLLLELRGEWPDGAATVAHMLWRDGLGFLLDGTSAPLHEAGAMGWAATDNEARALDYLRLFCHHVAGDNGIFLLAEHVEDLPWLSHADNQTREAVSSKLQSPQLTRGEGNSWRVTATLLYGRDLFLATFRIDGTTVEMTDDDVVLPELPVRNRKVADGWVFDS
jgi:tetratricopeptide (TPR) repeat protein